MIMGPIHRPNHGFGWAGMKPMRAASDNEPDGNANVPVNQGKFTSKTKRFYLENIQDNWIRSVNTQMSLLLDRRIRVTAESLSWER
jgi:hypothetical protein